MSNDIPTYNSQLLHLIHSTNHVSTLHALGSEIYVGCSDGTLLRYAFHPPQNYTLLSSQSVLQNKQIDDLVLLPSLSRAIIFTDHQILLYTLPSLDPCRSKPIRDVLAFAVDTNHLQRPHSHPKDPIDISLIKQNSTLQCSIRDRIQVIQEFPIPSGISLARRVGSLLCVADAVSYNMIHLKTASMFPMLPIIQLQDENESHVPQPSITIIGADEFLLLSVIGPGTIGIMVNGEGEPVRGTLQWSSHPESICLDYPHVITLLPNKSIEITHLESLQLIQVISPPAHPPRTLVSALFGFLVPSVQRLEKLRLVAVPLVVNTDSDSDSNAELTPQDDTNNTHPYQHSTILILSENSTISSLLPATLLTQAEFLLENHRIEDTIDLADQARRKMLSVDDDVQRTTELRYIYQRVGIQRFSETRFEDAGRYLLEGEMDPRIVVSYFPAAVRGDLFKAGDVVSVFRGVGEMLPRESGVDEIIKNYSPYLKPNTRELPAAGESKRVLGGAARDMLVMYLRRCRTRRLIDAGGVGVSGEEDKRKPINEVVDTVLAKILAESENPDEELELHRLVEQRNDIVLSEVVDTFVKNGQYKALCGLYERDGEEERLVDAWAKIADGIWTEMAIPSPLINMRDLLKKTSNRALNHQWSIWMLQKDVDMGIDLLISRDSKKSKPEEDAALLKRVYEASAIAGDRFLEYLVLRKRINDKDLHMRLATSCIDQLVDAVGNETTANMWRAKSLSYATSPNDSPYLLYFATTTPNSDHKRIRLKSILFLQGSNLYDVEGVLERVKVYEKVLQLEMAILFGKLRKHEDALTILANQMRDSISAEAYCTLGGDVVPAKVALSVGEQCDLKSWAGLVGEKKKGKSKSKDKDKNDAKEERVNDDNVKSGLLKVLLGVYMRGGEASADRTARLLNSQAMNLDVMDVLSLVPDDWSLSSMSSFLTRSFRRMVHEQHEGQILRAISAGENLDVSEQALLTLRDAGSVIEEAADDDVENQNENSGGGGDEVITDEKDTDEIEKILVVPGTTTGDEKIITEKVGEVDGHNDGPDESVADIVVGSSPPRRKEGVRVLKNGGVDRDRGEATL